MATTRSYGGVSGEERRATRRQQLLDAGYDLLAEGGPSALTVTGVCRRAKLTERYFYEHFTNRDAILTAIVDAEAEQVMREIFEASLAAGEDTHARGAAAVGALLDSFESDPRRAALGRASSHDETLLRLRVTVAGRMTAMMAENALVMWPGAHDDQQRRLLASSLSVGGVLQMVVSWLEGETDLSRDELLDLCARFVIATGETVFS